MLELYHKGGPVIWPLLVRSIVARTPANVLTHRVRSFSEAMLRPANLELTRFNRVLTIAAGSRLDARVRFNLRD